MVPDRSSMAVFGVVVLLALSGCLSGGQLSAEQEKQVIERFEERMDGIDGFTATMDSETTLDGTTHETTAEIAVRPGTGEMRQEVLAPEERAGDVTVRNETHTVSYDADANEYRVYEFDSNLGERDLTSQITTLVDTHDIYYNGTETLDGTETHKVTLVPNETAAESADATTGSAAVTTTMWLDAEETFPVKMVTEVDTDEMSTTSTVTYSDVELNPGLDDGRFQFDPPADATRAQQTGPDIEQFESVDALEDATDAHVPSPTLPDGFEFESGHVVDYENHTSISLRYTDGDRRVSVTASTSPEFPGHEPDGEEVDLGERTGYYQEFDESGMIVWRCDDGGYAVGGDVERSTLTAVATSVSCA